MSMIQALAFAVVVVTGLYFCALAAVSVFAPARASRFLLGFAGSPRVHYMELFIRLVVGGSLVIHAPRMLAPEAFSLFGWVLLITTACLLLLPWQCHHRFAQQVVPRATRYITLIGLCSLGLGVLILAAVIRGSVT